MHLGACQIANYPQRNAHYLNLYSRLKRLYLSSGQNRSRLDSSNAYWLFMFANNV